MEGAFSKELNFKRKGETVMAKKSAKKKAHLAVAEMPHGKQWASHKQTRGKGKVLAKLTSSKRG